MHLLLEVLAVGEGSWFMYAFVGIIGAFALAMVAATRSDEEKRRSEYRKAAASGKLKRNRQQGAMEGMPVAFMSSADDEEDDGHLKPSMSAMKIPPPDAARIEAVAPKNDMSSRRPR